MRGPAVKAETTPRAVASSTTHLAHHVKQHLRVYLHSSSTHSSKSTSTKHVSRINQILSAIIASTFPDGKKR
jgi:hypothetical protein